MSTSHCEATACTVVVGFDGSEAAHQALETALGFAQPDGRVFLTRGTPRVGTLDMHVGDGAEAQAISEATETAATKAAEESGLKVEPVIVAKSPVDALVATAKKYKADMIVVGAKGQGAFAGAVLGSTTYKLLHRSVVPVLVVPSP